MTMHRSLLALALGAHLQQHLDGGIIPALLRQPPLAEQRLHQAAPPRKRLSALRDVRTRYQAACYFTAVCIH